MKLEKYRHIQILKTLIDADQEVTADSLAKLTKSSLRTIKSDIIYLNSLCREEGICEIGSYKAKGYRIMNEDEEKLKELSASVDVLYSLFYGRSVESINRRMYILQRFLVNEYVKIEDLCDELFMSRSSIRKDIVWANRFLNSYHILLESVVGKGYRISGREQDLRSAMVELRCSQYHEFQPLYPYDPFDDMFRKDGVNHYSELRKAFLDILRGSRITVSDIETKKMSSHLCLMAKRIARGKSPEFDEEMIDELRQTYDYEVAKQIFDDPVIRDYVQANDIEIINFARLLLINRDLNLRINGARDLPRKLVLENQQIFRRIIQKMDGGLGTRMHNMDLFKIYDRDLESLQMQLYLKHHFDHTGKMRFITYQEGNEDFYSPIPLELTRGMISYLQKEFNEPISDVIVMTYAAVYERLFKKITYPYRKLRLAVTTTEGLVYGEHIRENLLDLFSSYISKIDVFNLYEMRKMNFEDYDAIVHSGFILYYNYPLPVVQYKELDYSRKPGEIFEDLFIHGFDRQELRRVKECLRIYKGERIRDVDRFVEALSYRYAKDPGDQKALYDQFVENEEIINHYYQRNGIVIIFLPYCYTHREILDIYIPDQNLYFEEVLEVRAVIAVSIDPAKELADLKIRDHILRYIVQADNALADLTENQEEALDQIFDTIVRRKFVNI